MIVRWSMPITIVVLFALAFMPAKWLGWTDWFAAQVKVAIVPVTHPMTIAIDTIVPTRISDPEASDRERTITNELERVRLELLQTRQENARLSNLIDQYARGAAITPELNVKQVTRPRIANLTGDILLIRTGNVPGLAQGTVVVADAVQLLGRVSRVDGRTANVLPITAPSAQPIMATVLLNTDGSRQARCFLKPVGDGTLRGEIARPSLDETTSIEVGQEVRLQDSQWPTSAQMLLIGTIEKVERNDEQPLRPRIIVRPSIADLRRVHEVILRIPITDEENRGGTP
jgi:cell shape-determining protein MreC